LRVVVWNVRGYSNEARWRVTRKTRVLDAGSIGSRTIRNVRLE